MKRFILSIIAILTIATSAFAADNLAFKNTPTERLYSWTGFYLGAHGGGGWGTMQDISNPSAARQDIKGGYGGIQGGYNYQFFNGVVLGFEADASFGEISKAWSGANQFDPYYGKDSLGTHGTLRGRLGYAFGRFMPYLTGGLAWGIVDHGFGCDATRVVATTGCQNKKGGSKFYVSDNDALVGYTIGGGAEYAINNNWSIKAEYLYTDYGSKGMILVDPNYPTKSARNFETRYHAVQAGVNYKF